MIISSAETCSLGDLQVECKINLCLTETYFDSQQQQSSILHPPKNRGCLAVKAQRLRGALVSRTHLSG